MPKLAWLGATVAAGSFLVCAIAAGPVGFVPAAFAQDAVRSAVGAPLQRAKSLMAAHKYAAADAQVAIADRQKNKSAYEDFIIQEMKGAIAQASGDTATAYSVYASLISSGRIGGAQLTEMLLAETSLSYQMKDYPSVVSWATRYFKAGGKDPSVHTLVIQAYYLQKDYADAAQAQKSVIDATLSAHKVPPEDQLQLLAACQKALGQTSDGEQTMQLLVTYYPKPSYWAALVYSVQSAPGFSDRLELDLDLFKMKVGLLTAETDYMEMIQLALGDNNPGKALDIIAAGNAAHVFGQPDKAAREQRLFKVAQSTAAQTRASLDQSYQQLTTSPATTAQQLFDLGQQYAGFKQYDRGVALMQQAIGKGTLERPGIAQLRVAEALISSGNKPAALDALAKVPSATDGTSSLAQLLTTWLNTQATLTPG